MVCCKLYAAVEHAGCRAKSLDLSYSAALADGVSVALCCVCGCTSVMTYE